MLLSILSGGCSPDKQRRFSLSLTGNRRGYWHPADSPNGLCLTGATFCCVGPDSCTTCIPSWCWTIPEPSLASCTNALPPPPPRAASSTAMSRSPPPFSPVRDRTPRACQRRLANPQHALAISATGRSLPRAAEISKGKAVHVWEASNSAIEIAGAASRPADGRRPAFPQPPPGTSCNCQCQAKPPDYRRRRQVHPRMYCTSPRSPSFPSPSAGFCPCRVLPCRSGIRTRLQSSAVTFAAIPSLGRLFAPLLSAQQAHRLSVSALHCMTTIPPFPPLGQVEAASTSTPPAADFSCDGFSSFEAGHPSAPLNGTHVTLSFPEGLLISGHHLCPWLRP